MKKHTLQSAEVGKSLKTTYSETVSFDPQEKPFFSQLFRAADQVFLGDSFASDWLNSLTKMTESGAYLLDYENAVKLTREVEGEVNLKSLGFPINGPAELQAAYEAGMEQVTERGVIWKSRKLAREFYPVVQTSQIPTETLADLLRRWGGHATAPLTSAIKKFGRSVAGGAQIVFEEGKAKLTLAGDSIREAGEIFFETIGFNGRPDQIVAQAEQPRLKAAFPGLIGEVIYFGSTVSLASPATLSLRYEEAELNGAREGDLLLFFLGSEAAQPTVISAITDETANTVTAQVLDTGIYFLARPVPTGNVQLRQDIPAISSAGGQTTTITSDPIFLTSGRTALDASWTFHIESLGVEVLSPDADGGTQGHQIATAQGRLSLTYRGNDTGTNGWIRVTAVEGDAVGVLHMQLTDTTPPAAPSGLQIMADQSSVTASWLPGVDTDVGNYKIYYREGRPGPPYDGTAMIDGMPSPVVVSGTNLVLRGLQRSTNYFVAVSAIDRAGNESPLSPAARIETKESAPKPPRSVSVKTRSSGERLLMWSLSEDDGYNARDVVGYEVYRASGPQLVWEKIATLPSGTATFADNSTPTTSALYSIAAVDAANFASEWSLATPEKFAAAGLLFRAALSAPGGDIILTLLNFRGEEITIQGSPNLLDWQHLTNAGVQPLTTHSFPVSSNKLFFRAVSP